MKLFYLNKGKGLEMNKLQYLNNEDVKLFINWISSKLDEPNSFNHRYTLRRPKGVKWKCTSIFSAFENYKWAFSCVNPNSGKIVKGSSFAESNNILSELSIGLRKSVEDNNVELTQKYCLSILEWGGVLNKNRDKIIELDTNITNYFRKAKNILNPNTYNTYYNDEKLIMNSGFTKIYSVLIDDFIIYDGRVGACLGLLVRKYCEESDLSTIPDTLLFAYGNAREGKYSIGDKNRRNPSNGSYKFPLLSNSSRRHIENNLRANWLLKEIITKSDSKFNKLNEDIQLRALEASFFMIGYDVVSNA